MSNDGLLTLNAVRVTAQFPRWLPAQSNQTLAMQEAASL